jgi:hypothetical protein
MVSTPGLPIFSIDPSGKFNVAEAPLLGPQSSGILAQGSVFIPPHEHSSKGRVETPTAVRESSSAATKVATGIPHPSVDLQVVDEQDDTPRAVSISVDTQGIKDTTAGLQTPGGPEIVESPEVAPRAASRAASVPADTKNTRDRADEVTSVEPTKDPAAVRPVSHLFTQSESAVEIIKDSFARFGLSQPRTIPQIRIHCPSGAILESALGTTVINGAMLAEAPKHTGAEQGTSPASSSWMGGLANRAGALPTPTNLPTDFSTATNAISAATSAVSLVPLGLPVGGKSSRKKRIIGKGRKLVLRKRVLAMILGRELADVVHPQISNMSKAMSGAPLPVDGPSDLLSSYARRAEYRRDVQRRQLGQKIAAARLNAEAEEVHRCRMCRGLTRTRYLQRYHRLQLKRDRPDMSALDRRATALARVVPFKCRCTRRLLGVENEVIAKESGPAQHLRGAAAAEGPLSGVRPEQD